MKINLEKLYKILRVFIYALPVIIIALGAYLVLFPSETYQFNSTNPNSAKFEIQKDNSMNDITFGIFPLMPHRYLNLNVKLKEITKGNCKNTIPAVTLNKTYQAYLLPLGDPITSGDQLRQYLFQNNSSDFPNGTLLHFKVTDQVYLLSQGQKILFPGPEIFNAFGYSFNNLTDVDQATLDQFPDSPTKVFAWSMPHPDDTIFESYPSHKLFLIANGQKHEIADEKILSGVWPKNFTIVVSDTTAENTLTCRPTGIQNGSDNINCRFDSQLFSQSFGGYYNFTLIYPQDCSVANLHVDSAGIDLESEKTLSAIKNSFRNIFTSILNRYLGKP